MTSPIIIINQNLSPMAEYIIFSQWLDPTWYKNDACLFVVVTEDVLKKLHWSKSETSYITILTAEIMTPYREFLLESVKMNRRTKDVISLCNFWLCDWNGDLIQAKSWNLYPRQCTFWNEINCVQRACNSSKLGITYVLTADKFPLCNSAGMASVNQRFRPSRQIPMSFCP